MIRLLQTTCNNCFIDIFVLFSPLNYNFHSDLDAEFRTWEQILNSVKKLIAKQAKDTT